MKKVVFGCLGAAVLIGVAACFAGYYFVYRPAKAFVQQTARLAEIPKLEAKVENRASFNAPASGELSKAQVDRFLRVQESILTQLGVRAKELDAKFKSLGNRPSGAAKPTISEVFGALKDLSNLVVDAKSMQVTAINQQKFSLEEYDWTRTQVFRAAGVPLQLEVAKALHAISEGKKDVQIESGPAASSDTVPPKNRELVAPHIEKVKSYAGLAFFGL